LHKNLKQVLAGAIKPAPARAKSGAKKATSRGPNHARSHR
jgi:hypothetical protein